jgi:chromosomal replication initiation ATPase DnaA
LNILKAPQLPLALPYAPSYGRDDFVAGPSNEVALKLIESWPAWSSPVLLLTGPPGSGKSHLVNIWASITDAWVMKAGALANLVHPTVFAGRAIAIEDASAEAVPEAALFHLINSVREVRGSLLITSRATAEEWQVGLPDLRSRLRMATPAALGAPDDELLRKVLVKLFADRQLVVDKALIGYLISRMERSLSAAAELVETLDREALAAGRRITRPMASALFGGAGVPEEGFAEPQ